MKAGQTPALNKQLIKKTQAKGASKSVAADSDSNQEKLMSDLNSLQYPMGSRTTIKIEVDSRRR